MKNIENEWGTKKLEFDTKEKNPKLSPNAYVFEIYEEHTGDLAIIKASGYQKAFIDDIEEWEKTLTVVSETLELFLLVQKKYKHLDKIMGYSLDERFALDFIRYKFDENSRSFNAEIDKLRLAGNAKDGLCKEGLIKKLNILNSEFEKIQKELDVLLNKVRLTF